MNGDLHVSSAEGEGTCFTVELPTGSQQRRRTDAIPTKNQQELDLNAPPSYSDSSPQAEQTADEVDSPTTSVALRASREISNTLFVEIFQPAKIKINPIDKISNQLKTLDTQSPYGLVIELCGSNRTSFSQTWAEFSLLYHATNLNDSHMVLAYHQNVIQHKDEKTNGVVKLQAMHFANESHSSEMQELFQREPPVTLIQNLRKLNPIGRRGQALLIGYEDEQHRHWKERLQMELSAEAWQCQSYARDTIINSSTLSLENSTDIILVDITTPDQTVRTILEVWFKHINKQLSTGKKRLTRVFIVSPTKIEETNSNRLIESAACEVLPFQTEKQN